MSFVPYSHPGTNPLRAVLPRILNRYGPRPVQPQPSHRKPYFPSSSSSFSSSPSPSKMRGTHGPPRKPKPRAPDPRPSASVVLLSPSNEVLLLRRVRTSSSFASAHVFPGGNVDAAHDGEVPGAGKRGRHEDGPAYRACAVRECFEETGVLLARRKGDSSSSSGGGGLLSGLSTDVVEAAREEVHSGRTKFGDWLDSVGAVADTDGLVPFTRWITPNNVPRRFTTQMYIYALPLSPAPSSSSEHNPPETLVVPTPDGGKEHTEASFAPASTWLARQAAGQITLFPPQAYLLTLLAEHLGAGGGGTYQEQRDRLMTFARSCPAAEPGDAGARAAHAHFTAGIRWADKVMCPRNLFVRDGDGRLVLGLERPGPELEGTGRGGDWERVVLARFEKGGPREVEVMRREDAFEEQRRANKKESNL